MLLVIGKRSIRDLSLDTPLDFPADADPKLLVFPPQMRREYRKLPERALETDHVEAAKTVFQGADAVTRLARMGLKASQLLAAVAYGYHSYISGSPNHPRFALGIWSWAEVVMKLREFLLPLAWRSTDENNYSLTISDEHKVAIQVSSGDEFTGNPNATPATKAAKGLFTQLAVIANVAQLGLWSDEEDEAQRKKQPQARPEGDENATWVLLMYRDRVNKEVRCELSLPNSLGTDGKINDWAERIILDPIPTDTTKVDVTVPKAPEIDVEVTRRTA